MLRVVVGELREEWRVDGGSGMRESVWALVWEVDLVREVFLGNVCGLSM